MEKKDLFISEMASVGVAVLASLIIWELKMKG